MESLYFWCGWSWATARSFHVSANIMCPFALDCFCFYTELKQQNDGWNIPIYLIILWSTCLFSKQSRRQVFVVSCSAYGVELLNAKSNFLMLVAVRHHGNGTEYFSATAFVWRYFCSSNQQLFRVDWLFTGVRVWNYCRRSHWRFTGIRFLLYQMLDLGHSLVAFDTMGVFP